MVAKKKIPAEATPKRKASPETSKKRAEQIVASADVVLAVPKGQTIPLEDTPAKDPEPTPPEGLAEYPVKGTAYSLLGMIDPEQKPTIPQIVAMARRLVDVASKLPRYIKRAAIPAYMFHSKFSPDAPVIEEDPTNDNPESESATKSKRRLIKMETDTKGSMKTTVIEIPNGVPLKKVCADIDIDPSLARRILRSKGKKPSGRWEWKPEDVEDVKTLLKAEAEKLK